MRILLCIIGCLFINSLSAQVYQLMPQYGYEGKRMNFDSTLSIPTVCGVPTLKSNLIKKSAIAHDTCNNKFYVYNAKTLTWSEVSGGGGGSIDTTSLSNRINSKLAIVDTANKWVNSVTKLDDSTIRVIKGTTTTDITLKPAATVTNATRLVTTVYNNTGSTILKGSVVYISGRHSSNLPTIAIALANNEINSYKTFALTADSITNNNSGLVIQAGSITGLNLPTSSYTDGDLLYLSSTTAGGYTTTKPLAPNHIVKLGSVTRAHPTFGSIEIKIENGWQLDELSDVKIAAVPNDSTILQFSRVDSLWHDVSINNAIGTKYLKPTDTSSLSSRINAKMNYADTASLSNRINAKMSYSDTASLSNRINAKMSYSDTASLSNRINTKMSYSDTASMSSRINLKVNISDTGTMLSKYLRKTDTATLSSRIGYALNIGALGSNYSASTTYYFGMPAIASTSTAAIRRIYIPYSGTIKACQLYARTTNATSTESWTISIRLKNTSNTSIGSVGNASQDKVWSNSSLSISVTEGDYIELITTTPAWSTLPSTTYFYGSIYIQP